MTKGLMMAGPNVQIEQQREYYAKTAAAYDTLHVHEDDEHYVALAWLAGLIQHHKIRSVLDVGSGTGRGLRYLKSRFPELKVVGVEPSADLREIGHRSGLKDSELMPGDATQLEFSSDHFEMVCEFGILHHINEPRKAITEMLRVASMGVFISDDNHFASGSSANRLFKRTLAAVGLWKAAYWLRTGGKNYRISSGDGLSYAYSVFDDLNFIEQNCERVHVVNTKGFGPNLYAGAPNVALFGRKLYQKVAPVASAP